MPKIVAIAGWSGSGKTTLVEKLIALLVADGVRVATIKHAHHAFDVDTPGKDSHRHRSAGAAQVLVSSAHRWALMRELRGEGEPALDELIAKLDPCDLVLVEGFKREPIAKIEVWRAATGKPALWREDSAVLAVASTDAKPDDCPLDWLDLDDAAAIATYIIQRVLT